MRCKVTIFYKEDKLLYRVIEKILNKYSYEVYRRGILKGFISNSNVDNVNDLSTMHKLG
ncbi:MAG: hypothetical protein HFJ44_03605 [Clostridia bacterium]|jgi:hypothetical protein|nr:hypothetical protein [Clostridia bacterium]